MKKFLLIMLAAFGIPHGSSRAQEKVDFAKDIKPIFEKSCIECHGPQKQKGKLRLDMKAIAFREKDPVIIVGQPDKSELYRRILLPSSDDDRMPNEGQALTKKQTDLIRDWIGQGANWPEGLVLGEKPKDAAQALESKPSPKSSDGELKAVAELEALGVSARPIALNTGWREANYYLLGTNVTDALALPLKRIPNLVHLNLGGTKITDAGLANLSGLTNLTRLHLEKTPVTDAGLAYLKNLTNLTYLNLYGTTVSDAGLGHLQGISTLRSLYLWQTKVSDEGVKKLQQALPKLEISRGWDLNSTPKPEEKKDEKKEEAK